MEIITRAEAKERGLRHYFTGAPCKWGHVERRNAGDGSCAGCNRIKLKLRNKIYAKKYAAEQRARYAADPIKANQASRKWKNKNRDKQAEHRRQRTQAERLDRHLTHHLSAIEAQDKPW